MCSSQSTGAFAPPTLAQSFPAPEHIKPNAYTLVNEQIAIRDGDLLQVVTGLSSQVAKRIRGLIRVRDAVRRCLRSQLDGIPDEDVVAAREDLNRVYDSFVAQLGAISARANTSAFRGDPDLPLLLSLEQYDEQTGRATKAAIFRERTIQKQRPVPQVSTPQEALLVTLSERGCVDLDSITGLLHRPPSEFLADLKGTILLNPQTRRWETEDEYLSGNVRAKLVAAEAAALVDEPFRGNVEALRQVQPTDLSATEIDARLGSMWIPAEDIQRFAEETLGESGISVSHAPELGLWVVRGDYGIRSCVANTTEWGTDQRSALELIEDALNLRVPRIYDHDPSADRDVVNGPATEAARDKQEKLKERFRRWVWQDDERRDRLVRKYNDEFNHTRLRTFNGDHLTLPGANPVIVLRPHQKASVWRILQTPNCLLSQVVGSGKTYTCVAAAMEMKRLGLARKPLIVVPNHMLGQFASEFLALYPGANILVATKDDGLTFEELGADRILGDEAHCWKNLFYVTKMTRIAGLPQTASQRALDMFLKVQHIQRINGGGWVVFATGTPIANSARPSMGKTSLAMWCSPPAPPSPTASPRCSPCSGSCRWTRSRRRTSPTSMRGPPRSASPSPLWNWPRTAQAIACMLVSRAL